MTKIEIELPDATAKAARDAGLLTPEALDRLLTLALRRKQSAESLLSVADSIERTGAREMSIEDIDAEVKATRRSGQPRAGGH
jgi:hypothetical protein